MSGEREHYRGMTLEDVQHLAEYLPWGDADEIVERIIDEANHPCEYRSCEHEPSAMPHEMFENQIRRLVRKSCRVCRHIR